MKDCHNPKQVPHLIDRLAPVALQLTRRRSAVFPDGWGDRDVIALLTEIPYPATPIAPIDVVWSREQEHPGFRLRQGVFTSPIADRLTGDAKLVPLELIEPAPGADRLVVLLPAWNDHGFEQRRRLALLLVELGVAALAFDAPGYGGRRLAPDPAIRTVADFALLGHGAVHEARSILAAMAGQWTVGVSGFSMGGSLAALVSATMPFPVATAPLAASHAPGPVYLDGVLRHAIAWKALGGRTKAAQLRHLLDAPSVLALPPPEHAASSVLVAGMLDGFVPQTATRAIAIHWPGAEIRWLPEGHASMWWRHRPELAMAIADSFVRLERHG